MKLWAVEDSNPLTVGAKKEQTQNEQNAIRPFLPFTVSFSTVTHLRHTPHRLDGGL